MKSLYRSARALAACIALLAGPAAAAQPADALPCEAKDAECWRRALRAHPVHRLALWQDRLARPLVERVDVAPAQLTEYLRWDNIANGWRERPRPSDAPAGFVAEVKAALAELPREVNLLFADKLAGVLLVDELGGTGYTDVITDERGHEIAGYIVLDASVLQGRRANEWATWKEASPFRADPDWRIEAHVENGVQDSRKQAIQYILLHELGHVLAIGSNLHPPWTMAPKDVGDTDGYTFFRLSWRIESERYATLFDDVFPLRKDVVYYQGAKLPAARATEVYAQLAKTNFPTLYAATHPGDDFAEAFASYVHVVMMRRPWQVAIRSSDGGEQLIGPCWSEARCAEKRRLLEQALGLR